jgi:hypothetical protein
VGSNFRASLATISLGICSFTGLVHTKCQEDEPAVLFYLFGCESSCSTKNHFDHGSGLMKALSNPL